MKQQIAGCRDRMPWAGSDFPKWMQFHRPRLAKQSVPGIRSDPRSRKTDCPQCRGNRRHVTAPGDPCRTERIAAALAAPGLTFATRKIAARVKAETTACGSGINSVCAVNGSDSVGGTRLFKPVFLRSPTKRRCAPSARLGLLCVPFGGLKD